MTTLRLALICAGALVLSLPHVGGQAALNSAAMEVRSTGSTLQSIASWLEKSGVEGAMGAEVADVLDILRLRSEDAVSARQMAFQLGDTLHLVQVSTDERREFLLFMVEERGQIFFYLSTIADGFKKAVVSVPEQGLVIPLEAAVAERGFREAVSRWEELIGFD